MAVGTLDPRKGIMWQDAGNQWTPEQIEQMQALEARRQMGGIDTSPVGHWTQGAARVVDALGSVLREKRLNAAAAGNADYNQSIISSLLGGNSGSDGLSSTMPSASTSSVAQQLASTSPTPADMNGNDVYNGFMGAVKGGVQNPYALAAIASTGNAESGFSPGNVNRSWSDPSESGQAGTAGGIMSWRGPRYQSLVASGDMSPAGQGRFFLQENPQLIAALNKAGSVQEAQSLMNNAWKFAGYDRPGGEAGRRLSSANSFLPTFQTNVASASPAAAAIQTIAPGSGTVDPRSAPTPSFDDRFNAPTANAYSAAPEIYSQPGDYQAQPGAPALPAPTTIGSAPQIAQPPIQMAQAAPSPGSGINPAIIRALSDPRANAGTRAVAQALMGQQIQQRNAAAERQNARDNWLFQQQYTEQANARDPLRQAQIGRAQIDLEQARANPGTVKVVGNKLVRVGNDGSVTDITPTNGATAGGFRFSGESIQGQALNGLMDANKLTAEQAQQIAAGKQVTGPNGEIYFMTPQGIIQAGNGPIQQLGGGPPQAAAAAPQSAGPMQPSEVPAGAVQLTGPKGANEGEKKAGGFADRMLKAQAVLDTHEKQGLNGFDQFMANSWMVPNLIGNNVVGATNPDYQLFDNARRNFINAQLRQESGAAIGADEYSSADKQYFPQPGDSQAVVDQKRATRAAAVDAMIRDAGPTYARPKADGGPKKAVIGGYTIEEVK